MVRAPRAPKGQVGHFQVGEVLAPLLFFLSRPSVDDHTDTHANTHTPARMHTREHAHTFAKNWSSLKLLPEWTENNVEAALRSDVQISLCSLMCLDPCFGSGLIGRLRVCTWPFDITSTPSPALNRCMSRMSESPWENQLTRIRSVIMRAHPLAKTMFVYGHSIRNCMCVRGQRKN